MSTRVVRSIGDFLRHGMDIDLECQCGHRATLDAWAVWRVFSAKRWPTSLQGAIWLPSAHAHFRCSKCGRRPKHIGPIGR